VASFAINKFQQEDVKIWGGIAVSVFTLMVLLSSLSAFLPDGIVNSLRETRQNSGTISQLQAQLTAIRIEFATMKRESSIAGTRMTLAEESDAKFSRRVRALESSIPMMLEALPADANIDRSLITASINSANGEEIIQTDDSVKVTRSDLFNGAQTNESSPATFEQQALPEMVDDSAVEEQAQPTVQLSSTEFGLVIGNPIEEISAGLAWEKYKADVGTLLIGLEPRLIPDQNDSAKQQLIAGPITDLAEAVNLCLQISKTGLSCETSGFGGNKLNR